jgi:hypothetical protein
VILVKIKTRARTQRPETVPRHRETKFRLTKPHRESLLETHDIIFNPNLGSEFEIFFKNEVEVEVEVDDKKSKLKKVG